MRAKRLVYRGEGLELRVQGSEFRDSGAGVRVEKLVFKGQVSVQGSELRGLCSGVR